MGSSVESSHFTYSRFHILRLHIIFRSRSDLGCVRDDRGFHLGIERPAASDRGFHLGIERPAARELSITYVGAPQAPDVEVLELGYWKCFPAEHPTLPLASTKVSTSTSREIRADNSILLEYR